MKIDYVCTVWREAFYIDGKKVLDDTEIYPDDILSVLVEKQDGTSIQYESHEADSDWLLDRVDNLKLKFPENFDEVKFW